MSSDLPLSKTPTLQPSQIPIPDPNNPYMYPSNPSPDQTIPLHDNNNDPELQKIKSSFWKTAAQLQSTVGSMTGIESLQTSGERAKREAEKEYQEAETRLNQGEPSRMHGEYDRLMGYVTYAIGHVAGDTEMQNKATERSLHGTNELDKIKRQL